MPLLKCNECHHEWEGQKNSFCDWCSCPDSTVLMEKTGLESFLANYDREWIASLAKDIKNGKL